MKVQYVVGYGAELPAETEIETPWGLLRGRRPDDTRVLDGFEDPGRGSLLVCPEEQSEIDDTRFDSDARQRVGLGFLLADTDDRYAAGARPWCVVAVRDGGAGGGTARQFRKGRRFETPEELARLERWMALVADPRLSAIAVHRSLSSATRLGDPVDSFIDAVIVWEALFGTGDTQELSYRVSMTMASVLGNEPKERFKLQREINDLYTQRSKVVHGGEAMSSAEALERRKRSVALTLDVLRVVLEFPEFPLGARKTKEQIAFVLGVRP